MRLVQFAATDGSIRVGAYNAVNRLVDISDACDEKVLTMKQLLECGVDGLVAVKRAIGSGNYLVSGSPKLLAPITGPDKVICVGMNYVDHCTEQNQPVPKEPVIFNKFPSTIIGPGDNIPYPADTVKLDWEVELVIVIGKRCFNVSREDAMSCVVGYTVAHDVSARDWQLERNGGQWLLGKTMNGFCPLGPCITTKEALQDPHNLTIECLVNDVVKQSSNTNQLVHKTVDLICFISRFCTLLPGDIILTGTPPGVGVFKQPPEFLKSGDIVTCRIQTLGEITNKVV